MKNDRIIPALIVAASILVAAWMIISTPNQVGRYSPMSGGVVVDTRTGERCRVTTQGDTTPPTRPEQSCGALQ